MTLEQIKQAVTEGKTVCWSNGGYEVRKTGNSFDIVCLWNNYTVGLTWQDGKTMNGKPEEFFIKKLT